MNAVHPTTIDELIARSEELDTHKHDYMLNVSALDFDPSTGDMLPGMTLFGQAPSLRLTENALSQLCGKSVPALWGKGSNRGTLPVDHTRQLRDAYPDLFAEQMRRFAKSGALDGTKWLVRGFDGDARAVLGSNYADIPNTDLLRMTQDACQNSNYTLVRPHVGKDSIAVKVIVYDKKNPIDPNDPGVGVGFLIQNDEIGLGSASVMPVIQRHSCTNSIVPLRDAQGHEMGVKLRHTGNARLKKAMLSEAIGEVLPHAFEALERWVDAAEKNVTNINDVIARLAEEYKWDKPTMTAVAIGTEGGRSYADLLNGITLAAHTTGRTPEDELGMETLAGELLYASPRLLKHLDVHITRR